MKILSGILKSSEVKLNTTKSLVKNLLLDTNFKSISTSMFDRVTYKKLPFAKIYWDKHKTDTGIILIPEENVDLYLDKVN